MGLIRRILGPRSKYIRELPYTYEATVTVEEDPEITNTFLSDTICGLVEFLGRDGVEPSRVQIREVFQGTEQLIDAALYADAGGQWLTRPTLCRSFETHYPGHVRSADCSFEDRDKEVAGC